MALSVFVCVCECVGVSMCVCVCDYGQLMNTQCTLCHKCLARIHSLFWICGANFNWACYAAVRPQQFDATHRLPTPHPSPTCVTSPKSRQRVRKSFVALWPDTTRGRRQVPDYSELGHALTAALKVQVQEWGYGVQGSQLRVQVN